MHTAGTMTKAQAKKLANEMSKSRFQSPFIHATNDDDVPLLTNGHLATPVTSIKGCETLRTAREVCIALGLPAEYAEQEGPSRESIERMQRDASKPATVSAYLFDGGKKTASGPRGGYLRLILPDDPSVEGCVIDEHYAQMLGWIEGTRVQMSGPGCPVCDDVGTVLMPYAGYQKQIASIQRALVTKDQNS